MRRDLGLEEAAMLGRHIPGDDEGNSGAPSDLDCQMRTFDLFDAAQEDERCFEGRIRAETVSRQRHAVKDEVPGAEIGDALHDGTADRREAERAARERQAQPHGSAGDLALIGHELGDRQRQDRREIRDAREAMDKVELAGEDGARESGGVARCVSLREARASRPRDKMADCCRLWMGEDGYLVVTCRQSPREHIDDPLDTAIVKRRHGQLRISRQSNVQRLGFRTLPTDGPLTARHGYPSIRGHGQPNTLAIARRSS